MNPFQRMYSRLLGLLDELIRLVYMKSPAKFFDHGFGDTEKLKKVDTFVYGTCLQSKRAPDYRIRPPPMFMLADVLRPQLMQEDPVHATVAAILSYAGKPLKQLNQGRWQTVFGWC